MDDALRAEGRFAVEIPIRWSATDERVALARLRTAQRIGNDVLAEYLSRVDAYKRDPEYRRLAAELREAKREKRVPGALSKDTLKAHPKAVPRSVTPRMVEFATKSDRNVAWKALKERHGLIGASGKVESLTPDGRAMYENTKTFVKGITGKQVALGSSGLDAATIFHEISDPQRDRALEYVGVKPRKNGRTGRPRFASRRFPVTSVAGSSSMKNVGAVRVDITAGTFTWKAAHGKHPITARFHLPNNDPWLRKAVRFRITQVRALHRLLNGKRRWYVQLIVVGTPPLDPQLRQAIAARPHGTVGIDVGSRHIAAVGPNAAILADLAPTMIEREASRDKHIVTDRDGDRRKKDRWYRRLQGRISETRARLNPDAVKLKKKTLVKTRDGKANGKEIQVPGGFKKGCRLVTSERVNSLNAKLAECARADKAARKNDHGRLGNILATLGDEMIVEELSYVGWQKSFGRQVRRYAPGGFESNLRRRAKVFNTNVVDVKTKATQLSRLCHCGDLNSTPFRGPIKGRVKPACTTCGRFEVQRDLYSAFLARFASETSVDLDAAQAAWAGAFGLLSGARQMYDRVEDRRIFRLSRAEDAQASPLCAPAPLAQAVGFMPPATVNAKRSAMATVQEESGRGHGRTTASGGGGDSLPHNPSQSVRRAPLPLFDVREYVGKVRAGPPLDMRPADTGGIRDG